MSRRLNPPECVLAECIIYYKAVFILPPPHTHTHTYDGGHAGGREQWWRLHRQRRGVFGMCVQRECWGGQEQGVRIWDCTVLMGDEKNKLNNFNLFIYSEAGLALSSKVPLNDITVGSKLSQITQPLIFHQNDFVCACVCARVCVAVCVSMRVTKKTVRLRWIM